jgi:8-oxo-dGTP pyrophosphatase MutT (NUDIX family)
VSYKPFFGTNMSHPQLEDRFGPDVMANPVGVSPALQTCDGFLLLGRRNASVAYYPGRVHPFAGALEPRDGGDVFAAVRRELREELSLDDAGVPEVRLTGLVREPALRQTELIFRARCRLTRGEIAARVGAEEHHGVVAVAAAPHHVAAALADPALTPVAVAALLLWGRAEFGDEWFSTRAGCRAADDARS